MEKSEKDIEYETYSEDSYEEDFKEDYEVERERFTAQAENSEIIIRPQCIDCRWNEGIEKCSAFGEKPGEYLANISKCPKFT